MKQENCFVWAIFLFLILFRRLKTQISLKQILIANVLLIGLTSLGVAPNEVMLTKLDVPRYVVKGEDVKLTCEYDLNFDMYSIKWYRNDREFFHYIPSMDPSKRNFAMPGINVDEQNSNGTIVILRDVNLDSEGRYKCEVSGEWPEYNTADKSATMEVVVIPKSKPKIYGANHQYRLGDPVKLTCVSEPSKPSAKLTWYINDKEAPSSSLEWLNPIPLNSGLEQSRLILKFQVTRRHFVNGKLTIRCSAQISPAFYKTDSVHKEITFNVPPMGAKEMAGFTGNSASSLWNRIPSLISMTGPMVLLITIL